MCEDQSVKPIVDQSPSHLVNQCKTGPSLICLTPNFTIPISDIPACYILFEYLIYRYSVLIGCAMLIYKAL